PVRGAPLRAIDNAAATAFGVTFTGAAGAAGASTRACTRPRKTGSLVYWAIPRPRVKGKYARSRSRVRQPSRWVSRVTTIASHPDASARASSEALRSSDADQYSWKSVGASGAARTISSIGTEAWLEIVYGTPIA